MGTDTTESRAVGKVSLTGTPFAHSSAMFRKGLTYNEDLPRGKDLDLFLRLAKKGKIGVIRDCFIKYRIRKGIKELHKKINDCGWHRKVIWLHHKDYPLWFISYLKVFWRECRLRYYDKIKNLLLQWLN